MNTQISILTAKSQSAVEEHLSEAGWKPVWRIGESTRSYPNGEPMDDGVIEGKNANIVRVRSAEIPWQISQGRDESGNGFDIGIVGTDCFVDHPLENIYVMGAFLYGRGINGNQPRLSLFSKEGSKIKTQEDLKVNHINALLTERSHLTKEYLDSQGIASEIYGIDASETNYAAFASRLQSEGKVPIKIIEGAGAQQLVRENDVLAMVRETGRRERNYNLHEIVPVCPIETLILVNMNSYKDQTRRKGIDLLLKDLNRLAISLETEGTISHKESLLQRPGAKER